MMLIPGMNLPVRMEWVGPDGSVIGSEGNRTVGQVQTQGGRYTCRAAITAPWMTRQPPQISHSLKMAVYSEYGQDSFDLTRVASSPLRSLHTTLLAMW